MVKAKARERQYLPTLSDLIDRMTIVQLKAIFVPERASEYRAEMGAILHDIDVLLENSFDKHGVNVNAAALHAVAVIMLTNRFIWENESKARAGGSEQDKLLKLTHSINGVRNTAKNQLAGIMGGRLDYKVDTLAADLPPEFGNWKVFE